MNIYKELYKITANDDLRPSFRGVYHDKGKLVAINGHVLAIVSHKYDPSLEGCIMSKCGEKIDASFLKYEKLELPQPNATLSSRLFKCAENLRGVKGASILIDLDWSLSVKYVLMIKDLMYLLNEYPDIIYHSDLNKGVMFKSHSVEALVMPMFDRGKNIYTYEEAEAYVKPSKTKNWYERQ